jgi:hypothetical protein
MSNIERLLRRLHDEVRLRECEHPGKRWYAESMLSLQVQTALYDLDKKEWANEDLRWRGMPSVSGQGCS